MNHKVFVLPYLWAFIYAYRIRKRENTKVFWFTFWFQQRYISPIHYSFLDFETRRCNLLLTFLLILEPSHFANHRPISYMLFGHSNEKSYCFIDSANDFQRLSFCQMFTTHIRVSDIQTSIARDSKGFVQLLTASQSVNQLPIL